MELAYQTLSIYLSYVVNWYTAPAFLRSEWLLILLDDYWILRSFWILKLLRVCVCMYIYIYLSIEWYITSIHIPLWLIHSNLYLTFFGYFFISVFANKNKPQKPGINHPDLWGHRPGSLSLAVRGGKGWRQKELFPCNAMARTRPRSIVLYCFLVSISEIRYDKIDRSLDISWYVPG